LERVAVAAGAVVAVMLIWSFSPELLSWLETLRAGAQIPSLPDNVASPSLVILVCLGLLAAPTVFDLYGASQD
jgi:hypothetical protein